MDNESRRHHYLPEFYIKKFCNSDGKIFIHDKLHGKKVGNISPKAPKSIFFEWDRNTINSDGKKTKIIEVIYREIEDQIAPYLSKLKSLEFKDNGDLIDVAVLRNLIYLGYLTKWRVPEIDPLLDKLNSSQLSKELNFFSQTEDDVLVYNSTMKPEFAKEINRLILPTDLFSDTEKYDKVFKDTFILTFPEPLFLTDNPFVEFATNNNQKFPSFIFPLTSNSLLIYCESIDKHEFSRFMEDAVSANYFMQVLYKVVQVTLMTNAQKYVGCQDRECLCEAISTIHEKVKALNEQGRSPNNVAFRVLELYKSFDQTSPNI